MSHLKIIFSSEGNLSSFCICHPPWMTRYNRGKGSLQQFFPLYFLYKVLIFHVKQISFSPFDLFFLILRSHPVVLGVGDYSHICVQGLLLAELGENEAVLGIRPCDSIFMSKAAEIREVKLISQTYVVSSWSVQTPKSVLTKATHTHTK